ncbi:MAG TPA: polysaccharide pyruvyl transferase family protein [Pseudorhizobium sp.]|nr:polysaccharide pyruvyl transferase family protein [Pseudorhizobium sp.]
MKIVITNYTGDRQNWGCQSTSLGLIRFLRKHLGEVEISTLPLKSKFPGLNHVPQEQLRLELVEMMRNQKNSMRILEATYSEKEIAALADADLVLFQGEGTMVGTKFYNAENLFSAPIAASRMFGKSVWSINQTVFSLDVDFTRFATEVYNTVFEKNFAREPASLHFLREVGVNNTALLPDLAFYDTLECTDDPTPGFPALSGMARIESLAPALFLRVAEEIVERHGGVCVVASADADMQVADQLSQKFGEKVHVLGSSATRHEAFATIKAAPFFVSGRYHMNIFAAKAATPFIPFLSNTHKNEGLSEMLVYPMTPRQLDSDYNIVPDLARMEEEASDLAARLRNASTSIYQFLDQANIFGDSRELPDYSKFLPPRDTRGDAVTYFRALNTAGQRRGLMGFLKKIVGRS